MSDAKPGQATRFLALLARPTVRDLLALLNDAGAETRIVGGAVRNTVLAVPTTDIDMGTTLTPDETMARAARAGLKVVPTGLAHGTVTIVVNRTPFEVTTLRRDVETDGRHAVIAFSDSFEEDALRRDFTINQLSLTADGAVHDYAGGLSDLAARKVRFIGDPAKRIAEDYLRIMRFFRFHAEYGAGPLDTEGLDACIALKGGMSRLSAERVRVELMKFLAADGAADALPVFVRAGIWQEATGGVTPHVPELLAAITAFPAADATSRLAALALRQADDAATLARRLKLSGHERRRLEDAARALALLGPPAVITEKSFRLAGLRLGGPALRDALGILARELGPARTQALAALQIPASPFRGEDVLAMGIAAGPDVGAVIERAVLLWADKGFPGDEATRRDCLEAAVRTAPI
jgi:poly(A) polymerase